LPLYTHKTADTIQHMLDALTTPSHELTKWEENFLMSIRGYFNRRHMLTDAQFERLDEIYTHKTA
jgi:hypothetical protein